MSDLTGSTTTSYDALYRTTAVVNPLGKAVTYIYDAANRRQTMTSPEGGRFSYTFDATGNLVTLVNPQGQTTTTTFDPLNRPGLRQLGNGASTSQAWDPAGRLTGIINFGAGTAIVNRFTYTYDNAGNKLGVTEVDGTITSWTYDPTYQLVAEQRSGGTSPDWTSFTLSEWESFTLAQWQALTLASGGTGFSITYTYDPAGNRLVQNSTGQLTTYTYDAANELLTAVNASGVTTYTYDADGNRATQETPTAITYYSWDEDDRMIGAEPVAGAVTFAYNADGQRVAKQTPTTTTQFVYDFQRLLDATDGSGALQNEYTYANNGFGDLVSEYDATSTSYHQYDGQLSTDALLDDLASTTDRYKYTAFDLQQAHTGTSTSPYAFVGQQGYYYDPEIDLYYLGMGGGPPAGRAHDAATGRFASRDPSGLEPDLNPYRYVSNNPANFTDPTGLIGPCLQASQICKRTPRTPPRIPRCKRKPPAGFWSSIGSSMRSMGTAYLGIYQQITGNPEYINTYQEAYDLGVFGQTKDSSTVYYYGTRGAVGFATAATGAAVALEAAAAAGITAIGRMTLGQAARQTVLVVGTSFPVPAGLGETAIGGAGAVYCADVAGYSTLQLGASWTWAANAAWIAEIASTRTLIYIAGPGGYYTWLELNMLITRGWTIVYPWAISP